MRRVLAGFYLVVGFIAFQTGQSTLSECAAYDNQTECAALINFAVDSGLKAGCDKFNTYSSAASLPPGAPNCTNWLQGGSICTWFGIECTETSYTTVQRLADSNLLRQQVTKIVMNSNNLNGTLSNISQLTQLRWLMLENNRLVGDIPSFAGNSHLKSLWLGHNAFTGKFPEISANEKLQYLFLRENQLQGTIPDLSRLTDTVSISLTGNKLTGTVPELKHMINLQSLWLDRNQLTGQLPALKELSRLQTINFQANSLTSIPADFCSSHSSFIQNYNCHLAYNKFQCMNMPACAAESCDLHWCRQPNSSITWFDFSVSHLINVKPSTSPASSKSSALATNLNEYSKSTEYFNHWTESYYNQLNTGRSF